LKKERKNVVLKEKKGKEKKRKEPHQ